MTFLLNSQAQDVCGKN